MFIIVLPLSTGEIISLEVCKHLKTKSVFFRKHPLLSIVVVRIIIVVI